VGHIINEVWQTTNAAKTKQKPNNLWLPKFGLANYGWEPNESYSQCGPFVIEIFLLPTFIKVWLHIFQPQVYG
jgi:hypothetical protein